MNVIDKVALTQGVVLHKTGQDREDDAWVTIPVSPLAAPVNPLIVNGELEAHGYALIPEDEAAAEMVEPGLLQVWCYTL